MISGLRMTPEEIFLQQEKIASLIWRDPDLKTKLFDIHQRKGWLWTTRFVRRLAEKRWRQQEVAYGGPQDLLQRYDRAMRRDSMRARIIKTEIEVGQRS